MALTDRLTSAPRSDVYELAGVELFIPTDEQLAKTREKYSDIKASVSIAVRWKPKTYEKYIGDDKVEEEVDYYRLTNSNGVEDGQLELIREAGFNAIPANSMYKLPSNKKADINKQARDVQRFLIAADRAGLVVDVDESGKLFSPQVGQLFSCLEGPHEMPTWDSEGRKWDYEDTKSAFFRLPVENVTGSFVQPEELAVRRYERRDDAEAPATTTTSAPAAVTAEDIKAAFAAIGISGKPVAVINAQGTGLVSANISKAPAVFGSKEVMQAAQSGKLVEFLVEKGVAAVNDGVVNIG